MSINIHVGEEQDHPGATPEDRTRTTRLRQAHLGLVLVLVLMG